MITSENSLLRGTVLMNVRGRDVGGFVDQAKRIVSQRVSMPTGYYIEWSGQYENQIRAKQRLQIVIPVVLVIIFVMLYMTYHSAKEALHVLLAVPFALTGGVFLLKYMGFNFSVAVWVGFIALFGTAVQTGVVMVIYLEEAVRRKIAETGPLTRETLREAVIEGALLRLRPKVMTVCNGRRRLASDHVVDENWCRSHETSGHPSPRRHDQFPDSCPDSPAGHFIR
jgi:Cu(I)/Ag(I) efflux system membrane protein CusA/SilA